MEELLVGLCIIAGRKPACDTGIKKCFAQEGKAFLIVSS